MKKVTSILIGALALLFACGSGKSEAPMELTAASAIDKGEQIYRMHCVLCHGKDGKLGFNGAKDLTMSALDKSEMIARVANGKGTMVPYKNVLNAKEIDAVVAHVRSLPKSK